MSEVSALTLSTADSRARHEIVPRDSLKAKLPKVGDVLDDKKTLHRDLAFRPPEVQTRSLAGLDHRALRHARPSPPAKPTAFDANSPFAQFKRQEFRVKFRDDDGKGEERQLTFQCAERGTSRKGEGTGPEEKLPRYLEWHTSYVPVEESEGRWNICVSMIVEVLTGKVLLIEKKKRPTHPAYGVNYGAEAAEQDYYALYRRREQLGDIGPNGELPSDLQQAYDAAFGGSGSRSGGSWFRKWIG